MTRLFSTRVQQLVDIIAQWSSIRGERGCRCQGVKTFLLLRRGRARGSQGSPVGACSFDPRNWFTVGGDVAFAKGWNTTREKKGEKKGAKKEASVILTHTPMED
ncbi:hypothetical protein AVEN_65132-1 [Araneus ventricosus]|uniref:Uncharacterized protein n=1 Tax=Araneus ventricosus TaxID=182803 RepID=A0A4Y2AFF2_ARAVE|nr:hypothetical protein AVEN_65132-1 [Araneus ventricosus]